VASVSQGKNFANLFISKVKQGKFKKTILSLLLGHAPGWWKQAENCYFRKKDNFVTV
jgi:hypothetical protein